MNKKIISALMAVAMCVSAVPVTANAELLYDADGEFYYENPENSSGSLHFSGFGEDEEGDFNIVYDAESGLYYIRRYDYNNDSAKFYPTSTPEATAKDYILREPYQGNYFESDEFKEFEAKKYDNMYVYWWEPVYSYTGYDDVEYLEFTQKFHDTILLNPDESETNRLINNFAKAIYDDYTAYHASYGNYIHLASNYFGVIETEEGYEIKEITDYSNVDVRVTPEERAKFKFTSFPWYNEETYGIPTTTDGQSVSTLDTIEELHYKANPYITAEEFVALSLGEQIAITEKIREETGLMIANVNPCPRPEIARLYNSYSFYCNTDGQGQQWRYSAEKGKYRANIDIVDGKIVEIPDIVVDNVDILKAEKLTGDANIDGDVDIADAVFIMQCLSNPDEYKLSEQGLINADYNGDGGVTAIDALEIQMSMIA